MDTMAAKPPITFQVIDWFTTDYENEDESDSGGDSDRGDAEPPKSYLIKLFGMDEAGTTVSLNVTGFTPYFYVKLPGPISNQGFDAVSKLLERFHHSLVDMRVVRRKDFWGFTNSTKFWFIRLSFKNHATMRSVERVFAKPVYIPGCGRVALKVYESNVEPFLRFIHRRNISPSGWVTVTNYHNEPDHLPTHCKRNLTAAWTNVTGVERAVTAPFVIASFDLECTSSHGDFPVPKKDYMRMAREMADLYRNSPALQGNPTALRKTLRQGILAAFSEEGEADSPTFSRMYPKKRVKMAKLEDVLDMHMQELVEVLKGNIAYDEEAVGAAGAAPEEPQSAFDIITENQRQQMCGGDDDDAPEPLSHDKVVTQLNEILTAHFPSIQGDSIIQIGTVFQTCGLAPMRKVVLTLGTCTPIPDIEVVPCATERELLLKWADLVVSADPDILIGYNIFGFDMSYLAERASELGCSLEFLQLGRIKGRDSPYVEKNLSSSALGDNVLKMIQMEGRVSIDLMKVVQRDHKLDTYKLDNVAAVFMKGGILSYEGARLVVDRLEGISANGFIKLGNGAKVLVTRVEPETRTVWLEAPLAPGSLAKSEMTWGLAKDDITPQQIFQCQKGTADDRALIAKYCIQDCQLCNFLMIKLQILANNFGMSNVCSVPLSYIFQRGQGVKIFSLVAKQAAADGFVIPTIRKPKEELESEEDDGYEGAIVLDPIPGIYIDEPISVLDYASLYPSSMISENISHDSIVLDPAYDNLPGMEYLDITYDLYEGEGDKKRKSGERVCRYAQFPDGEKGIIPRILQTLLVARKTTRKKMEEKTVKLRDGTVHTGLVKARTETELVLASGLALPLAEIESTADSYDDFQKAVLDGLQLAYKVTANSVYGQVGAKTSAIHMKDLAASTTATGRNLILTAKAFLENECGAKVIYGDTDSVFAIFPNEELRVDPHTGAMERVKLHGKDALKTSIKLAQEGSERFRKLLKKPHDLEYEKTFFPFIILSKKRYVGNKYEMDDKKFKQNSMGIVLKRRDNANIVKHVYGGVLDIILNERDVKKSITFLNTCLTELIDGRVPLEQLVITKTLRGHYKNPRQIAHKVLADRMKERDPGSAPQSNDRIPYVYVRPPAPKNAPVKGGPPVKPLLQGERIETPAYILAEKLVPDYEFYMTNQIMKPVVQLYSLILEQLKGYKRPADHWARVEAELVKQSGLTPKKIKERIARQREKDTEDILFGPYLKKLSNRKQNLREISSYFKPKPI
jgi:DNA polymerase elongation subunit (family B)